MISTLNHIFSLLIILTLVSCNSTSQSRKDAVNDKLQGVTTIAFGSCNRQDRPQPLWIPVISHKPDVWIWLGDNIYGDTEDMDLMKEKYDLQLKNEDYQKLVSSSKVIGTWDDHDYGKNDAGKEYPRKVESRELMYDFLGIANDSELRKREGAYSAHIFGENQNKVKVILLDARYFRDELKQDDNKAYILNTTGSVLGEAQWKWLENELEKKDAAITIIGSGIQFISEEHPFEKWHNFPNERKRLFDLLQKTGTSGVILLSGDRHIAEISKMDLEGLQNPLYDITSSGLTHTWKEERDEPNQHRVGGLIAQLNFGLLHFHWEEQQVKITMEIRGEENKLLLSEKLIVKK
ncbi:MAG: alkaline phosphatase family protein [Bacteroidota bacterium]|nr:alkaline phosphatase family protein [Bacteroidota bacterium]